MDVFCYSYNQIFHEVSYPEEYSASNECLANVYVCYIILCHNFLSKIIGNKGQNRLQNAIICTTLEHLVLP